MSLDPKADPALVKIGDDTDEMLQAATETVELPDYQHIVFPEGLQAGLEPWSVVSLARGPVGINLLIVDAGDDQGIALEVE
ncbi:hypothetical protein GCM10011371_33470 [Novosphingobium marinum]|uniref:Uncharacterized protein n=1 Tax=Novosphingobium marinum TaxID=1514948 RepID=A0A7Z0BX52_9SPHN|nr:hypothetical protein [Novosphingobium marinum]GGC43328.1 hypothetical protein GCM10011371_33470 [Novosphingobium marinum]